MMVPPAGHLLIFNAGSSSLKFELFAVGDGLRPLLRGGVTGLGRARPVLGIDGRDEREPIAAGDHAEAADLILERLHAGRPGPSIKSRSVLATGHRVVHGGDRFSAPARVDADVLEGLRALAGLAPLHNPPALAVMESVEARLGGVPMFAAFDTAFFGSLPEHALAYAVPRSWRQRYRIRRFGFHGIAHEYLHGRYRELAQGARPQPERVVSLHLGQGCSATALLDGAPVETSMGFTPLEGLVMGTRPGDLDAGALLHLVREGMTADALDEALNRESGLRGLSGASDDVRELLELEAANDADAALALAAFRHRIVKYVGAYAAVLGGLDAILFGGGIGENSAVMRGRICSGLAWLGVELDERANAGGGGARVVSTPAARVGVYVIPVHEEAAIARAVLRCLAPEAAPADFSLRDEKQ